MFEVSLFFYVKNVLNMNNIRNFRGSGGGSILASSLEIIYVYGFSSFPNIMFLSPTPLIKGVNCHPPLIKGVWVVRVSVR